MVPHPTMRDANTRGLDLETIRSWILEDLPELEGRVLLGEGDPYLTIPVPDGGRLVIGTMKHGAVERWVLAVPDGASAAVHDVEHRADYVRIIRTALAAPSAPARPKEELR